MTKEVELYGLRLKLYRVKGYDNAWCSDPQLVSRIEQRRKEILDEISLKPQPKEELES